MRTIVIYGCMFAGKTTTLIKHAKLYRDKYGSNAVLIAKHTFDTRYGKDELHTHDNDTYACVRVSNLKDLLPMIGGETRCVLIDEAQFFSDFEEFTNILRALQIKRLVFSGLDTDYLHRPFGEMAALIAAADVAMPVYAECAICGKPATSTHRKVDSDSLVLIGSDDMYEPVCAEHHSLLQK
jgi:thymidine kinase